MKEKLLTILQVTFKAGQIMGIMEKEDEEYENGIINEMLEKVLEVIDEHNKHIEAVKNVVEKYK